MSDVTLKQPPHSLEAEQSLLGALLDNLRELAIAAACRLAVWAIERRCYRLARPFERVMRHLVNGRSAAQVSRMERRMGLR